jgi:hypothetical protein
MPIITIYQGASGEGQELAESVAGTLGYRCVGREALVRRQLCLHDCKQTDTRLPGGRLARKPQCVRFQCVIPNENRTY